MRCPFLQEAVVRSCRGSGVRTMIRAQQNAGALERCATEGHRDCPHHPKLAEEESGGRCPYLDEAPVQFCEAAPVMKYIPHSEPLMSRCGSERHRYCDAYLTVAAPGCEAGDSYVEDIRLPARLRFSPNHFWYDETGDGTWNAGIDGLMARVLGRVEGVSFLTGTGTVRPAVVVKAHGVDLNLVFPRRMVVTGVHTYLRERPGLITDDPYGRGWLFEGVGGGGMGLPRGAEARAWMEAEWSRLARFAHDRAAEWNPELAGDGGAAVDGLIEHLSREQILALFHEFFPAYPKGDETE
jgi:glycine cleavage system H lipoate-binding protein